MQCRGSALQWIHQTPNEGQPDTNWWAFHPPVAVQRCCTAISGFSTHSMQCRGSALQWIHQTPVGVPPTRCSAEVLHCNWWALHLTRCCAEGLHCNTNRSTRHQLVGFPPTRCSAEMLHCNWWALHLTRCSAEVLHCNEGQLDSNWWAFHPPVRPSTQCRFGSHGRQVKMSKMYPPECVI